MLVTKYLCAGGTVSSDTLGSAVHVSSSCLHQDLAATVKLHSDATTIPWHTVNQVVEILRSASTSRMCVRVSLPPWWLGTHAIWIVFLFLCMMMIGLNPGPRARTVKVFLCMMLPYI